MSGKYKCPAVQGLLSESLKLVAAYFLNYGVEYIKRGAGKFFGGTSERLFKVRENL
ncbi:hypothetical protein K090096B2_31270 [Bacteroides fragilis]